MVTGRKALHSKWRDYRRFSLTLLIISSYLYMGGIIDTYIQPAADGTVLFLLSLLMGIAGGFALRKAHKIKASLEEK